MSSSTPGPPDTPWTPAPGGWQPTAPQPAVPAEAAFERSTSTRKFSRARNLLRKYGRMLWWAHSLYALGLGLFVVLFAAKGFSHARFLTITLALAWVVLILFFRLFGSGAQQQVETKGARLRFFVMTYVLKNMYQGMLFFLLPFYWRSVTLDSPNQWFLVALGACAFLATLDVVFDRMLMRWKFAASTFYLFTLFACLNLVIPALLPDVRAAVSLVVAAAVSALAFWSMHVPVRMLGKPLGVALLAGWTVAAFAGSYFGRGAVPPVAMSLANGAVGPKLLPDGRLAMEARALHVSLVDELFAVTDVMIPGGRGDRLIHVWSQNGEAIQRSFDVEASQVGDEGTVRLRSKLAAGSIPTNKAGAWRVDVLTEDGQLVGRVQFEVIE